MHVILALGHQKQRKNSVLCLTVVTFLNTVASNESLYVDFFFSPSLGYHGNRSWGFGFKKEAVQELPTFTDKFLVLFAPWFFLQSKCFLFSPFQHSSIFPAVFWWFSNNQISVKSSVEVERAWSVPTIVPVNFTSLKQQDTGARFNPHAWFNLQFAEKPVGNTA